MWDAQMYAAYNNYHSGNYNEMPLDYGVFEPHHQANDFFQNYQPAPNQHSSPGDAAVAAEPQHEGSFAEYSSGLSHGENVGNLNPPEITGVTFHTEGDFVDKECGHCNTILKGGSLGLGGRPKYPGMFVFQY